ncbi:MAG TPA: hypothetical protein DER40_15745 [Geobacter sp.]|nr:hypothetical protein [Geobacter sp.]HCE68899.1 hypothetical protein [Geobacter sp.]
MPWQWSGFWRGCEKWQVEHSVGLFWRLWAVKKGQFEDVEKPKHRMLDDE